ncbi:MAG TPA: hypothetical protein PKE69_11240 [Pyrinomonadaceae bacterium]|nr:hypothetical protein [Pyrinomonadaceae bacterium]
MKIKFFAITLVASFAAIISACGGGATNTANNTANNAKPANNTNTTTNTNSANNSTNAANNSANNTAATTQKTDGETVNLDAAGVKITVPKGFKHEKDGDAVLVTTPDDGVFVVFSVPGVEGDFEAAVKESAKTLDTYMKDVKVEAKDQKDTINGMEAIGSGGSGVDKESGEAVEWRLMAVKTDKKPVLIIIYGEKASLEKNQKDGEALMSSLKKQ